MINFQCLSKMENYYHQDISKDLLKTKQNQKFYLFYMVFMEEVKIGNRLLRNIVLIEDQFVITVDLRNHGGNEFKKEQSYLLMAEDVTEIINYLGLSKVDLLGHSMGGKLAMVITLLDESYIDKVVVADIAPVNYGEDNQNIIDILLGLDLSSINNRAHADEVLSKLH